MSSLNGKDVRRCLHYARFLSKLTLTQALIVFWLLFFFVLLLMCVASIYNHKSINLGEREKSLPPAQVNSKHYQKNVKHIRERYLVIVTLCLMVATVCVVLEAFALFNIEYCDGEDLMQLFWGFWSILQVGSLIAIFGVMLQFWIVLGSHEHPSWGVALGTPVLVFAALAWIVRAVSLRAWARLRGQVYQDSDSASSSSEDEDEMDDEEKGITASRWWSRAPTIVNPGNGMVAAELRRSSTF